MMPKKNLKAKEEIKNEKDKKISKKKVSSSAKKDKIHDTVVNHEPSKNDKIEKHEPIIKHESHKIDVSYESKREDNTKSHKNKVSIATLNIYSVALSVFIIVFGLLYVFPNAIKIVWHYSVNHAILVSLLWAVLIYVLSMAFIILIDVVIKKIKK